MLLCHVTVRSHQVALDDPMAPIRSPLEAVWVLCVWVLCPLLEELSQLVRMGAVGWWAVWRNRVDAIMLSALVGALVLRVHLGVRHDAGIDPSVDGEVAERVCCRILMASSAMFQACYVLHDI